MSGESPPPPIGPLPSRFTPVACRGATSRSAPCHTVVTSQTVRRRTGLALGRQPVRGVRSEGIGSEGAASAVATDSSPGVFSLRNYSRGHLTGRQVDEPKSEMLGALS